MENIEKALWDTIVEAIKKNTTLKEVPQVLSLNLPTSSLFEDENSFEKMMFEVTQTFWLEQKIKLELGIQKNDLFDVIESIEDIYLYFHLQASELGELVKKLKDEIDAN